MLVHSSEHNLLKNLLLFITAKWCINKEPKQSKTKSQVFNICQEREATRRVFPSGPGAGAVVTAARLLGPPVSSGVWSQEPEIPAKKRKEKKKSELCLAGLVHFWKQNSQVSGGLAHNSLQLLGRANATGTTHGTTRGTAWRTSTCVTAAIYRVVCCESDIWSQQT